MDVKYPEITATLTGQDGNVFNLMGIVSKAMREGGVSPVEIKIFTNEIFDCGSYDEALQIMMNWVDVN